MGSPPLRAKMSGAVTRLISSWADTPYLPNTGAPITIGWKA
jgi:hypothetical protein